MANLTERGNKVKRFGGFEYVLRKDRMGKNGELTWRCREHVKFKCSASIRILKGLVLDGQGNPNHSHPGDPLTGEVRQVQSQIRSAATAGQDSTRSILAGNLTGLPQDVLQRLPKRSTLEDSVKAKRRATNPVEPNPQTLNFAMPARFTDIVLHDSGSQDPSRILILGDMNLLNVLENAEVWLGDGTFAVVPTIYFQLYTIHAKVGNKYPHCVYFLLPNKTQATYVQMLEALAHMIPDANPQTILTDFENAAQNAFRQVHPNADIKGCLFHLGQSVQRKVAELGLKVDYESNVNFNMSVKSLVALSFVPEEDILDIFNNLADSFPPLDRVDELLAYFELTYIQGRDRGQGRERGPPRYPPSVWNHFSAPRNNIPRTTNAVEGYHNGLNSLFLSQHPSVWKLMDGLNKDISLHLKTLADNEVANNPPPRNKYIVLSERLATRVDCYAGANDKLQYLRSVAHIFSS